MSELKRIAILTPYFRDFNTFARDNHTDGIAYYHVTDIDITRGKQYNGIIKLYGWREIKNIDELISMIKFRTVHYETN